MFPRFRIVRFSLFSHRPVRALFVALTLSTSIQATAQGDLDALLERARTHEKAGDYSAAAAVYEQALAGAPGNLEVLKRLGVLEQTELKFDSSIDRFQKILARNPQYSQVNFYLGVSYLGRNALDRAIESFLVRFRRFRKPTELADELKR